MRHFLILLIFTALSLTVGAQSSKDSDMDHMIKQVQVITGQQKYDLKKDNNFMPVFSTKPIHDNPIFVFIFFDRFEQRLKKDDDIFLWDINASLGGDYHKLLLESEGEILTKDGIYKESRNELLYAYGLTAFWDLTLGYRRDIIKDKDDRSFATIGVKGMAPFLFEIDGSTYISEDGDLSAIAEVEYSFLISQKTKFIPRIEMDLSFQDIHQYDTGAGLTKLEFGGRLSYELAREFAPYVGISWDKLVFETANIAETKGEETSHFALVIGLRLAL